MATQTISFDVFISYCNSKFNDRVYKLSNQLRYRKVSSWIDTEQINEAYNETIVKESITRSKVLIVCLNDEYINSGKCMNELRHAVQENKPIIYVVIEDYGYSYQHKNLLKRHPEMAGYIENKTLISYDKIDKLLLMIQDIMKPNTKKKDESVSTSKNTTRLSDEFFTVKKSNKQKELKSTINKTQNQPLLPPIKLNKLKINKKQESIQQEQQQSSQEEDNDELNEQNKQQKEKQTEKKETQKEDKNKNLQTKIIPWFEKIRDFTKFHNIGTNAALIQTERDDLKFEISVIDSKTNKIKSSQSVDSQYWYIELMGSNKNYVTLFNKDTLSLIIYKLENKFESSYRFTEIFSKKIADFSGNSWYSNLNKCFFTVSNPNRILVTLYFENKNMLATVILEYRSNELLKFKIERNLISLSDINLNHKCMNMTTSSNSKYLVFWEIDCKSFYYLDIVNKGIIMNVKTEYLIKQVFKLPNRNDLILRDEIGLVYIEFDDYVEHRLDIGSALYWIELQNDNLIVRTERTIDLYLIDNLFKKKTLGEPLIKINIDERIKFVKLASSNYVAIGTLNSNLCIYRTIDGQQISNYKLNDDESDMIDDMTTIGQSIFVLLKRNRLNKSNRLLLYSLND